MVVSILVYISLALLVGLAGLGREGGFLKAFLLAFLFSPLLGINLVIRSAMKTPNTIHVGPETKKA